VIKFTLISSLWLIGALSGYGLFDFDLPAVSP